MAVSRCIASDGARGTERDGASGPLRCRLGRLHNILQNGALSRLRQNDCHRRHQEGGGQNGLPSFQKNQGNFKISRHKIGHYKQSSRKIRKAMIDLKQLQGEVMRNKIEKGFNTTTLPRNFAGHMRNFPKLTPSIIKICPGLRRSLPM